MKRFRYSLDPALDAARAVERSAALVFAASQRAATDADAEVTALVACARAVVARAASRDNTSLTPRAAQTYVDCECRLRALELRRTRAADAATNAEAVRDDAQREYEKRMQRRRAFEAHRERARHWHRQACELAEAAEFDEANAFGHEARSRFAGTDRR